MIRRFVDFALNNRLLVLALAVLLFAWGVISFKNLPIEAYMHANANTPRPARTSARLPDEAIFGPLMMAAGVAIKEFNKRDTTSPPNVS